MEAIRNKIRDLRMSTGFALALLCMLLVSGPFAEATHDELVCEHGQCAFCVGSAADDPIVDDEIDCERPTGTLRNGYSLRSALITLDTTGEQFIRGPPAT